MKRSILKPRDDYLDELIRVKDKPLIKVVKGIRRCGKSSLLDLFIKHLTECGVPEDRIVKMTFTHIPFSRMTPDDIVEAVRTKAHTDGKLYVILDEVQEIDRWENAAITIFEEIDADLYVTGSNSVLVSPELETKLAGRIYPLEVFPLSYREYLRFTDATDSESSFDDYLRYGGFPIAALMSDIPGSIDTALEDIYNSVVLRDIVDRNGVRDVGSLDRVIRFLMRNIGSPLSVKRIADYFVSSGKKIDYSTIEGYLEMIERSMVFYKAKRYDVKTMDELKINHKFYLTDMGLKNSVMGMVAYDPGQALENLVYFELRRRGYKVNVGKIGPYEIDFRAERSDGVLYCQVSYSVHDPETEEKEVRPLRMVDDSRKIIVTMKPSPVRNHSGITEIGIREFLCGDRRSEY